jgi:hypothetical protein
MLGEIGASVVQIVDDWVLHGQSLRLIQPIVPPVHVVTEIKPLAVDGGLPQGGVHGWAQSLREKHKSNINTSCVKRERLQNFMIKVLQILYRLSEGFMMVWISFFLI